MRIETDPRLPMVGGAAYDRNLSLRLYEIFRRMSAQINGLAEGRLTANYSASTAAPSVGTYYQGDFIRNSTPTELGTAGSKYCVFGWLCTVSGTPGTWVQQRMLTGN